MSPENTHKLMGFYMEGLILGTILYYMVSARRSTQAQFYSFTPSGAHQSDSMQL